tara:strand:- start:214 stop:447 length:234 start_codon:yes stop_codon:yes gene_type:complete
MKNLITVLAIAALMTSCQSDIESRYNLVKWTGQTELGTAKTMNRTNGTYWYAYFPKVNHTMIIRKKDNFIISVEEGK